MALNGYFLVLNFYGLYYWRYAKQDKESSPKIIHLSFRTGLILFFISSVLFVFIGKTLIEFTDSTVPYQDALLAALSIAATWMVARKILEVWYIWIFVNLFSAGLYYWLSLYPTAILYAVYGVMSFVGLIQWRRSMLKQTNL